MPKVSVLIAAYNIGKYISRCLESVVCQTLEDIEIIVVDDCSTDSTPEIIDRFAASDKRIKVIRHEENLGLSWVRKSGIEAASGDYLTFVDGDDSLRPDACAIMYQAAVSEGADAVVAGHEYSKLDGTVERTLPQRKIDLSHDGFMRSLMENKITWTLWAKLYSKELFSGRQLEFRKHFNNAEDLFLTAQFAPAVRKLVSVPETLYVYYQNSESLTQSKKKRRDLETMLSASAMCVKMTTGMDDEIREMAERKAITSVFNKLKAGYDRKMIVELVGQTGLAPLYSFSSLSKRLGIKKAVVYWSVFHSGLIARFFYGTRR